MKKFFALIIAFFMLFAFVGCDNSTEFDFELRFNKIFEDVDVDNVTSDLKLPTSIGSLTIVWESSNTDVLSNGGKIFNTTGEVISVTLTAHMQHEKEKADLSKDLKIAPTGGIKDILEGETGTYKIKGTVVAINARSFIISDGTNGILVFKGGSWACDVEIGEVLELRGETTKYPTSLTEGVGVQFGQGAVYTRVSTGTYTYPAAKELKAADVENYAKEKIIKPEYVKLTGKLSVSDKGDGKVYYNLVIDGTKIKGSLAYPTNSEELKALDGKNVEVYGYIVYGTGSTSVNFLNIVSTEVKEVGGGSVVEPDPETKKISDILAAEDGSYTVKGTVVAINARSFIISDETNSILVFKGGSWACDVKIGEVLELSGETTKYPTSLTEGVGVQFGQGAVYTRVSTGTYTYPAAKELKAADVENYAKEKIIKPEYVKLTGKLSVSDKGDGKVYYNLVIDGTKIKGSLAYPTNSEELKALDGKNVEVYGYIVYGTGSTSVNFLNIVSTEVKEVGGGSVVEPDPETKKISDILAAEDGSYTAEGTVIATYARGFLIDDTTGKILVFLGQEFDGSIKVGDTVKVQGSTSVYGLMKQFGLDTTVEKTGEGAVDQPTATEIDGAKLDEFADLTEAQVQYVKMTGKLTVSGNYFNLEVSGASKVTGSITYPQDQEALNALAGKNIEVTGYFIGVTGSSKKYANIMVTEFKEVGGSVIEPEPEPEPEPITGDVVLDFVKNFGTYAGSWSTSYEPKTITGKDLGLNNSIKVVISIANKQKDDQPIADRPVIAVGKKGIEQTVVVSGFEGKLKDVTFNLKQWNEKKKFDSIIIEYSEDGTTWTKASDDAISGGSSAIATNQEVKSNVDLSTAKYIRLYIKADSSSNQQLGLTSISLNFEK